MCGAVTRGRRGSVDSFEICGTRTLAGTLRARGDDGDVHRRDTVPERPSPPCQLIQQLVKLGAVGDADVAHQKRIFWRDLPGFRRIAFLPAPVAYVVDLDSVCGRETELVEEICVVGQRQVRPARKALKGVPLGWFSILKG